MIDRFALGRFIAGAARWTRHDLSASESAPITLAELLALAAPADLQRWQQLELGYTAPRGAEALRSLIATRYAGLDADDVLCCAGAQEAVACVARALLRPADHAIVVVPIYQPSELAVTRLCSASGVALEETPGGWRLDIDAIAAAIRPATRLVLVNFPNSPTGAAIDHANLTALVALCRHHGLWLVNDEVYRLSAPTATLAPPVATLYERGVSIDAVSKGLGLPGLRAGWIACRDRGLLDRVLTVKSQLSSCLAAPSEFLARIALGAEAILLARSRPAAQRNRQALQHFLDRHPEHFAPPRGEGYGFALPRYLGDEGATRFATALVREAGVLVLPSRLWRTPLAAIPGNHLRFGLGKAEIGPALAAIEQLLDPRQGNFRRRLLPIADRPGAAIH